MKRLYPLAILLLSFSLSSCGDDSDPIPESELPTIEESYTAERRQILESLGINPDELDEEVFGVYIHDHFLVVSALRKTDEKLIVAVFDSIKNTQVIHDYSIAAPKTVTKPYYDEQVEYRLRSITPQIIRINDGFICLIGTRYRSEQVQDFFDTTYAYFNNGTKTICRKMEDLSANCPIRPWYENSCLLISDYGKTLCVTTEGEIKIDLDANILRDHQYPLDYDKYIELSLEAKNGKTGMTIVRKHIAADGAITVWSSHVHLSGSITTSARMSCTATMNEYGGFIIDATIIEKDGTQCDCHITLNAETGEVLSSTITISSVIHP